MNQRASHNVVGKSGLKLNFGCGLYDRMLPLYRRLVEPQGIDLNFVPVDDARNLFDRMGESFEFDISEMSSSEYISRVSTGDDSLVALPVFPSRLFRHSFIFYNERSGIRGPADFAGRRVGVQLYTMTAAIWIRGLLQDEYGVDLSTIRWVEGAFEEPGPHGDSKSFDRPVQFNLEINRSPKSLNEMLIDGEIEAAIGARTIDSLRTHDHIKRAIPDYREAEKAYFRKTGIFPIMHLLVIKREIYEKHPFVAASMFEALCKSKQIAEATMRKTGTLRYMLPWLLADIEEIDEVFGGDHWPYGFERNRTTLETLVHYMTDQQLITPGTDTRSLFLDFEPA